MIVLPDELLENDIEVHVVSHDSKVAEPYMAGWKSQGIPEQVRVYVCPDVQVRLFISTSSSTVIVPHKRKPLLESMITLSAEVGVDAHAIPPEEADQWAVEALSQVHVQRIQ